MAAMMPFDGGDPAAGPRGSTVQPPGASGIGDKAKGFDARKLLDGDRYKELDRRQTYYDATNHDWKRYDFDGRIVKPGLPTSQPLLSSEQAGWYVPLKLRRPSSPYRLAKFIVNAFTSMLFGESRWPNVHAPGDQDTEEFAQALIEASSLATKMIRARALGGSVGSVAISWCYREGAPRVDVHNAKHVFVYEWEDRDELVPSHAIEVYRYVEEEWNPNKKKFERIWYWHRRDWTPEADIVFKAVRYQPNDDPVWTVDQERSNQHDDGFCHLVWIQNIPTDDVDGLPDYDGLYENFDALDMLCSVLMRGTTLNLDPTLVIKQDKVKAAAAAKMGGGSVRKGSDHALWIDKDDDAKYLELSGSSVEAGVKLFETKRKSALEVAQCVAPDPNEIAAAGLSSVAMKVIYAPMTQKVDLFREQYGKPIRRLIEQMLKVARAHPDQVVKLPPKVESEPEVDDKTGKPTGEESITIDEHDPGQAEYVVLRWGAYFLPTPADQSAMMTMLSTATGTKAFMSKQTATEIAAEAFGRDPVTEWKRLADAEQQEQEQRMSEFTAGTDAGGKVDDEKQLPFGAKPRQLPSAKKEDAGGKANEGAKADA